jgi:phospholipid N-methyltransferase
MLETNLVLFYTRSGVRLLLTPLLVYAWCCGRDNLENTNFRLSQYWKFFQLYLKDHKQIGAVVPSSAILARAMLDAGRVDSAPLVVELGAGTGSVTKAILRRIAPDARLLAFEIMPELIQILRHNFDDRRLEVVPRSATELCDELHRRGFGQVGSIISGIPFNSIAPEARSKILYAVRTCMSPEGRFVTFQHTPFQLPLFRSIFSDVQITRVVMLNVPPALVIACKR